MFIQLENEFLNLSGVERVSFSEYPDYTGQWRADLYFFGDSEGHSTLPQVFPTEAEALRFVESVIGHAVLTGVCTLEDQDSIKAQLQDEFSQH